MVLRALGTMALVFFVSSCAQSRDPNITSIYQAKDMGATCFDIEEEYRKNTLVASVKIKKNTDDDAEDVFIFGFVWPGSADFKNADGVEGNALLDRNVALKNKASFLYCSVLDWPWQPKRYG